MSAKIPPHVFTAIIEDIYTGSSVIAACTKHGIGYRTFYDQTAENPIFAQQYSRACQARTDLEVEELKTIADTDPDPQRARNRIDVRKWIASKLKPQVYGERLDLNVSGNIDLTAAIAAGKARASLPGRYPADTVDAETIDTKQLMSTGVTGSQPVGEEQPVDNKGMQDETLPDPLS